MRAALSTKDKSLLLAFLVPTLSATMLVFARPSLRSLALFGLFGFLTLFLFSYRLYRAGAKGVRAAFKSHTAQHEALLAVYSTLQIQAPLPTTGGTAACPDFLLLVMTEMMAQRPTVVVEAGSGVSTVVIGHTLRRLGGGKLISLEHELQYAEATRKYIRLHGLQEVVDVVHAPLKDYDIKGRPMLWYDISAVSAVTIDLLVLDGPPHSVQPMARYPALPLLGKALSPNAVILLDDADRPDERRAARRWKREFSALQVREIDLHKGALVIKKQQGLS